MNNVIFYETTIISNKKEKKISELSPNSNKKIRIKCPSCGKINERFFKVLSKSGKFECQKCILKKRNSSSLYVIGMKKNRWTLVGYSDKEKHSIFKCSCGVTKEVDNYAVASGRSKSCGCFNIDTLKSVGKKPLKKGSIHHGLKVIKDSNVDGMSVVECFCGSIIERKNRQIISGSATSCGCLQKKAISDYHKNNPSKNRGANHPNWKGGISGDRRRIMATNKYKEWRSNVFKRDDYKCKKCNKNSNTLEAHHINEFANNKLLATELDNGITFCKKCHKLFHKTYGNSNLNIEKVNEFINI